MAWSKDEKLCSAGSADRHVCIWNLEGNTTTTPTPINSSSSSTSSASKAKNFVSSPPLLYRLPGHHGSVNDVRRKQRKRRRKRKQQLSLSLSLSSFFSLHHSCLNIERKGERWERLRFSLCLFFSSFRLQNDHSVDVCDGLAIYKDDAFLSLSLSMYTLGMKV